MEPAREDIGGDVSLADPDPFPALPRASFDARRFMPERVASDISRRYEIEPDEMGSGAYGRVFFAKDRMFKDRSVAIKMVRFTGMADTLSREVSIMKELDHPSVCKIFETYVDSNVMFFVIEHLDGGDLCSYLNDVFRIEEGMAALIVRQVSSALHYAHNCGIAHRDIKPENVCFCNSDPACSRVKVIDWGLSKQFFQERMRSGVGTKYFMAPEVLESGQDVSYTSKCDIWSLGVMTYIMISGKPPFWGKFEDQLRRMREGRYPMTDSVWDAVSAPCKSFIAQLLKYTPDERLPAARLLTHGWLAEACVRVEPRAFNEVLSNLKEFSHAPDFLSICAASVARHLDHRSLGDQYRVFSKLDADGDGRLDFHEMKVGFEEAFGADSKEVTGAREMFARMDLDCTGRISYTEFCAAGIGKSRYTQEHAVWAAFKSFDLTDNGRITKEEMRQVLSNANVDQTWAENFCNGVASNAMEYFESKDGSLDFKDWLDLIHSQLEH